jgi:hypothetical protein
MKIGKMCECGKYNEFFDLDDEEDMMSLKKSIKEYEKSRRLKLKTYGQSEQNFFMKLTKEVIKSNMLVYDDDAASGQITKRLISLMKVIARNNDYGPLVTLYMPNNSIEQIEAQIVNQAGYEYVVTENLENILGVEMIETNWLDTPECWKSDKRLMWKEYFIDGLGASLAPYDENLLIGVTASGKAIGGSF